MGCIGMGKGRSPWGSVQESNFFVLLTTSKLWQDFVYHDSSKPCLSPIPSVLFSSSQPPRVAIDEGCNGSNDQTRPEQDWLTDWLTGWRTVMRCLRMYYDWVSNLIVYTNFIYVTWVHFVLYPRACTVGWKFPVHPVPEREDRKWSVSAICNAFSRFSIGNVWISDAISGKGKSRK